MRAAYGTSHPEVAETLHELGQLARRRGDLAEAESRLGEALAMRRKFLGERHYLTAKSLAALGAARLAGNDPTSARQLLEDAVVILRRTLPANHHSSSRRRAISSGRARFERAADSAGTIRITARRAMRQIWVSGNRGDRARPATQGPSPPVSARRPSSRSDEEVQTR